MRMPVWRFSRNLLVSLFTRRLLSRSVLIVGRRTIESPSPCPSSVASSRQSLRNNIDSSRPSSTLTPLMVDNHDNSHKPRSPDPYLESVIVKEEQIEEASLFSPIVPASNGAFSTPMKPIVISDSPPPDPYLSPTAGTSYHPLYLVQSSMLSLSKFS